MDNKKRFWASIVCALTVMFSAFGLGACSSFPSFPMGSDSDVSTGSGEQSDESTTSDVDTDGEDEGNSSEVCAHEWGEWTETTAATCETAGVNERTCAKCEETETETVAATGHAWANATCTAPKTCGTCGATEGEANGHAWDNGVVTTDPTCEGTGVKTYTCGTCGETYTETVAATGHAWANATCTSPKTCDTCGATEGEANGHAWDNGVVTTEPTCEGTGIKTYTCGTCGETYTETVAATGHAWANATCTAPKTCDTCGATEGEANGHDLSDWITNNNGTHSKTCATENCKYKETEDCSGGTATCMQKAVCDICVGEYGEYSTSHIYDQEKAEPAFAATAATCDAAATYYKSCVCGAINQEEIFTSGEALGHDWKEWTAVGDGTHTRSCANDGCEEVETEDCAGGTATCTAKAKCTVCGEEYGDEPAHAWDNGVVTTDPTCEEAGVKTYTCGACGETKTETIGALGHTYNNEIVAPTCTQNGYTTHTCGTCGNSYNDTDVEATGHDWDKEAVTCEEGRKCNVCGAEEAALDHDYKVSSTTAADCTNAATVTYTCNNCGGSYTDTDGDANGHQKGTLLREDLLAGCQYVQIYNCVNCGVEVEGDTVYHHSLTAAITTAATCQTDGVKTLTCTVEGCDHTETQAIEKNEEYHVWNAGVASEGMITYTCTVEGCGETKTSIDASAQTSANVSKEDLQNSEVKLQDASISMDSDTLEELGDNISLSAGKLDEEARAEEYNKLTDEQKTQLGNNPIYNFEVNGGEVTDFNGFVTVTLPYELADGEDVDNIAVWYIDNEGKLESISATYIEDEEGNGYVTFKTNHFSYYTVTRLTPKQRCELYGHQYRDTKVEMLCTADGYDLHVCIRCAHSYKDNIVAKTGHTYTESKIEPSCTKSGKIVYSCGCGHTYETKLNALGHAWVVSESQEATCEHAGYIVNVCENDGCEATYTEKFAKLTHVFTDTVVNVTCESNGYTLHDCDNCDYSYTDSIVLASGHDYETAWEWSEDYETAKLVFTCKHCDATFEIEAEIEEEETESTCDKHGKHNRIGKVHHNGHTFIDKREHQKDKKDHKFDDGYKYNKHGHWHQCKDCKGKVHEEEHSFDKLLMYRKRPTCVEKGEAVYECKCGATEVFEIEATGEHFYQKGQCVSCGKEYAECDHTELKAYQIDLGDYGCCDSILKYTACDCGKVAVMDTSSNLKCRVETVSAEEGTTENGNMYQRMVGKCSVCGMMVYGYAEMVEEGCLRTISITYSFEKDGKMLLENATVTNSYEQHNTQTTIIDLAEKGACGGKISADVCLACGKIDYLHNYDIDCDISEEDATYEEKDGYIKATATCSTCQFYYVIEKWSKVEGCITIEGRRLEIYKADELILAYEQESENANHSYETTRELLGETCEDGVVVTRTCTACDESYSYTNYGHDTTGQEYNLSDYGACGGYLYVSSCACGEVNYVNFDHNCSVDIVSAELVTDENGIEWEYYVAECEKCPLHFELKQREVEEGCTKYLLCVISLKIDETVLLNEVAVKENVSVNHEYVYTFEMQGETCQDGVTVSYVCVNCNESGEDYISHHSSYKLESYNLTQYSACGGYVYVYGCPCGYNSRIEWSTDCNLTQTSEKITDSEGVVHTVSTDVCSDCGLVIYRDSYTVKENCYNNQYTIFTFTVGEETILSELKACMSRREAHTYEYTYVFANEDAPNCEDGVTVTRACKDCDYSTTNYYTYHSRLDVAYYNLSDYGACGGYIEYESCPCGYETYFYDSLHYCNFESDSTSYEDENGIVHTLYTRTCADCGLIVEYDEYRVKEGCYRYTYRTYTITMGEETIVSDWVVRSNRNAEHVYEYTYVFDNEETRNCEDGVTVTTTCQNCDYSYTQEYTYHDQWAVRVYYNLSNYGACGGSIEYYSCPCGYSTSFSDSNMHYCRYESDITSYEDESGIVHTVYTRTCIYCGLVVTYDEYRVKEGCYRNTYRTYTITMGEETIVSDWLVRYSRSTEHTYEYTFKMNGESCTDGCEVTYTCKDCGYSNTESYSHHRTYRKEYENFADYGACYGYYEYVECACGEVTEHNVNAHGEYTENQYPDEEDHLVYVSAYTCTECGFKYINSYYSVRNSETCKETTYYTLLISVGDSLVVNKTYETVEDSHRYTITGSLEEGATSCNDGVNITYTCQDCEYSYTQYYTYHYEYELQRLDTTEYGSVCGGYMYVYGCACGYRGSIDLHNLLCDHDSRSTDTLWLENLVSGKYHYTTEGNIWFSRAYAYSCVCSVTDPIQCAFTYRYASYYSKEADACKANYYTTVQVYNAETDTWTTIIHFKTGSGLTYHDYVAEDIGVTNEDGSYVTGTRYTCSDCGSYYETSNWYDAQGRHIKSETFAENKLDNGEKLLRQEIDEYTYVDTQGERYGYRDYYRYVNADGTEYWRQTLETTDYSYVAPYGESSYKETDEYTNSDGYYRLYEYGYTYITLNGSTRFETVYEYHQEADSWYRYDYTYDVEYVAPYGENGYSYVSVYTNSGGANSESGNAYTYITVNGYTDQYNVYNYHKEGDSWYRYDYTYNFDGTCEQTEIYTNSDGANETYTHNIHKHSWKVMKNPTCTQDGIEVYYCPLCNYIHSERVITPYAHNWDYVAENHYYCTRCGLENANGATGDIVLEDMTADYGNGENYVAGYYAQNNVEFIYNVSLILHEPMEDGDDQVVLDFDAFIELEEVRAIAFSISEIEALATELGYTADMYDVRFAFVPVASDGSFDYAITFTDSTARETEITGSTTFTHFVGSNETLSYTIIVEENSAWTFTSSSQYDSYACLYDSEGNLLIADDDSGEGVQFLITYILEAGKTYRFDIRWLNSSQYGYMPVAITAEPMADEEVEVVEREFVIGNNPIEAADVTYVYLATESGTLMLTASDAVMGAVEIFYSINNGEVSVLELSSSVEFALEVGDTVVIDVIADGYATITASLALNSEILEDDLPSIEIPDDSFTTNY